MTALHPAEPSNPFVVTRADKISTLLELGLSAVLMATGVLFVGRFPDSIWPTVTIGTGGYLLMSALLLRQKCVFDWVFQIYFGAGKGPRYWGLYWSVFLVIVFCVGNALIFCVPQDFWPFPWTVR